MIINPTTIEMYHSLYAKPVLQINYNETGITDTFLAKDFIFSFTDNEEETKHYHIVWEFTNLNLLVSNFTELNFKLGNYDFSETELLNFINNFNNRVFIRVNKTSIDKI